MSRETLKSALDREKNLGRDLFSGSATGEVAFRNK